MKLKIPSIERLEYVITDRTYSMWWLYTQIFIGLVMAFDSCFSSEPMVVSVERETGVLIGMAYAWFVNWVMTKDVSYQEGYTDRIRAEITWVKTGNESNLYS